jgi:hypothetical protein
MKIWIVSAGWDHSGDRVLAVCTTAELADAAKAKIELDDRDSIARYDFIEVQESQTDVFSADTWPKGSTYINPLCDESDRHIPILEYQTIRAV